MEKENIEENKKVVKKKRLSLFSPQSITEEEINKTANNSIQIEYLNKIKTEEDDWKQIYKEMKEKRVNLMKELKVPKVQKVDYNTFTEEDRKFLDEAPNYQEFLEKVKDLENLLKTIDLQNQNLQIRGESIFDKICFYYEVLNEKL